MQLGVLLLALGACERAAPVTGEVSLGDEHFTPERCTDAARVYGMAPQSLYFDGEPGGLFVTPPGPDAAVMYHPPRETPGDTLIIAIDPHCSTWSFTDGHIELDCDARDNRRLRADLRFGSCP